MTSNGLWGFSWALEAQEGSSDLCHLPTGLQHNSGALLPRHWRPPLAPFIQAAPVSPLPWHPANNHCHQTVPKNRWTRPCLGNRCATAGFCHGYFRAFLCTASVPASGSAPCSVPRHSRRCPGWSPEATLPKPQTKLDPFLSLEKPEGPKRRVLSAAACSHAGSHSEGSGQSACCPPLYAPEPAFPTPQPQGAPRSTGGIRCVGLSQRHGC